MILQDLRRRPRIPLTILLFLEINGVVLGGVVLQLADWILFEVALFSEILDQLLDSASLGAVLLEGTAT